MKIKPPISGVIGAVPEHMQDEEERALIESGRIDNWIAELEAGETPKSNPITGEWATVQEVAARHRLSAKTIRKAIHEKRLAAVDHGSGGKQARWRVHRDAEAAWIAGKGERSRDRAARSAHKSPSGKSFKELIQT